MKLIFNLDTYAEIPGTLVKLKPNFKLAVQKTHSSELDKFITEDFEATYVIKELSPDYDYTRHLLIKHTRKNFQNLIVNISTHWVDLLNGEYIKL